MADNTALVEKLAMLQDAIDQVKAEIGADADPMAEEAAMGGEEEAMMGGEAPEMEEGAMEEGEMPMPPPMAKKGGMAKELDAFTAKPKMRM